MATFKSLEIRNFRAYKKVDIEFDSDRGIYLFSGDNGSGKSTFLNAINWCLYGDTPFYSVQQYVEVVNDNASDDEITSVKMGVVIDDARYSFRRTTKRGIQTSGVLEVQKEENGNWIKLDSLAEREAVNSILPKDIRHLFFFNGEQLRDIYTSDNKEHNLKDNVYRVAEINVVDNAINHLRELEATYLREITRSNKNADKIRKLQDDKTSVEAVIKNDLQNVDDAISKKEEWDKKIADLDAILRDTKDGRLLQAQRDNTQNNIKKLSDEIEELKLDKQDCVKDAFHKALLHNKFKNYYDALNDAKEKNLIPPPVDPKITEEILRTGICICGEVLTDKGRAHIMEMNEEYARRKELQFLTNGIYKYSEVNSYLVNAKYIYGDICEKILKKTAEKERLSATLKTINEQLEKMDLAKLPKDPEFTRTQYVDQLENCRNRLLKLKNSIEENKKEKKRIEEELKKAISKDETSNKVEEKRQMAERLIIDLETIKSSMEMNTREKLCKRAWASFSKILPSHRVEGIQINEDYEISLVTNDGRLASINRASTGQVKALGLSLVHALSMDLGYSDAPLLIDNLYGDISEKHSTELTKLIGSLANDKQIIIMNLDMNRVEKEFSPGLIKGRYTILETADEGNKIMEYEDE